MSVDWSAVQAEMQASVGFTDDGNDDNPWGPEQGVGNNQPYCCSFAHIVPFHHGYQWPPESTFGPKGDAYCPTAVAHGSAHGEVVYDHASHGSPADLKPGDQVFYDWNGTGTADHVETVTAVYADGTFDVIGANTGTPKGVHVLRRDRRYLLCRRRPSEYGEGGGTPTVRQGSTGDQVRAVQQRLVAHGINVPVDGDFGPLTDAAVRRFQAAKGLTVDGIVGPQTWGALAAD